MSMLKVLLLQGSWFLIVLYAKSFSILTAAIFALSVMVLNYIFFSPRNSSIKYTLSAFVFLAAGVLHDGVLLMFNIVENESYTFSYLALWPIFMCYYDDIFKKFKDINVYLLSIVGGIGASLAYWSCIRLGALSLNDGHEVAYIGSVYVMWALFFPGSIKMFNKESLWDWILDKTIIFSFDNTGFRRHAKDFDEDISQYSLKSKNALVTGGSSGIGGEVAKQLSRLGISVYFTGRNKDKGETFKKEVAHSEFISLDMADLSAIDEFCKNCENFDYLALNAGGMPEEVQFNEEGVEFQCASQLVGHYLLIEALRKYGKINSGCRIVWVSSGGMYLKKLDLEKLFSGNEYEKVDTYANVKRAQVTLVEELANNEQWRGFTITSMHPGWVGTSGLKNALPRFYNLMESRLRSEEQGADTITWLLVTKSSTESGSFYFDRKIVSPYISKKYNPSQEQREELVTRLESLIKAQLDK
ncbi:MAG: SDR family NAD(P)-dependent oxidoreductase [Bacteriovoracaceae bacterium]|nr:SDR family NAD(P)-dependent oxidoreductase [Bacteriovoracaceae bacterium]